MADVRDQAMDFFLGKEKLPIVLDDAWWAKAGMESFQARRRHYNPLEQDGLRIVEISRIQPRLRARGFNERRLMRILKGFKRDDKIPPIHVTQAAEAATGEALPDPGYPYRVQDGFHRYFCSLAAGFTHIPVIVIQDPPRGAAAP